MRWGQCNRHDVRRASAKIRNVESYLENIIFRILILEIISYLNCIYVNLLYHYVRRNKQIVKNSKYPDFQKRRTYNRNAITEYRWERIVAQDNRMAIDTCRQCYFSN